MFIDGHNAKLVKNFTSRQGNPITDVDLDGNPVQANYIVIVRYKDCRFVGEEIRHGRKVQLYSTTGAPQAFPLAYGGTYYGYTEWKKRHSRRSTSAFNTETKLRELVHDYWQSSIYFVRDGKVYIASIKRTTKPHSFIGRKIS